MNLSDLLLWFFNFLLIVYGWVILRCWQAWRNMPVVVVPEDHVPCTRLSVIIPVRNEKINIINLLDDLAKQKYPAALFEILVVDDFSEDQTAQLVKEYAQKSALLIKYIKLDKTQTGKKAAIKLGVLQAQNKFLVFTDGDCRVQPGWLQHIEYIYQTRKAKFISGPVSFHHPKNIFEKVQLIEFASLIGVGAASLALGTPNMCNGANIAYTKQIFEEVNGFSGNEHIASGDDEFLMHKVFSKYPEAVVFLKAPAATVLTSAKSNVADFFNQRVRWASKWPAYRQLAPKLTALLVFAVNFWLLLAYFLWLLNLVSSSSFAVTFFVKVAIDFVFLLSVLNFFNRRSYWKYIIPLQLIYVPYIVITALFSLKRSYTWKERRIYN